MLLTTVPPFNQVVPLSAWQEDEEGLTQDMRGWTSLQVSERLWRHLRAEVHFAVRRGKASRAVFA